MYTLQNRRHTDAHYLTEYARSVVTAGGKRVRCRLAGIGYEMCTAKSSPQWPEELITAGSAIELFHAFALVHDDIIDEALQRRSAPTVHRQATDLHQKYNFYGPSERFGESVALLVGDYLFAVANRLIFSLTDNTWCFTLWNDMCDIVVAGQGVELLATAKGLASEQVAYDIIRMKTGQYSFGYPLRIGAAIAGLQPSSSESTTLAKIGIHAGQAFQLQDDLLDVYGNPDMTGKSVGSDVATQKPTVFRNRCLSAMVTDGSSYKEAAEAFAVSNQAAAEIGDQTGAHESVLKTIESSYSQAIRLSKSLGRKGFFADRLIATIQSLRDRKM